MVLNKLKDNFLSDKKIVTIYPYGLDEISLTLTSDYSSSISQSPQTFAMSPKFFEGRGVIPSPRSLKIVGLLSSEDPLGRIVDLIVEKKKNDRFEILRSLDILFEEKILCFIKSPSLGIYFDMVCTSLNTKPSTDLKDTLEIELEFVHQPIIDELDIDPLTGQMKPKKTTTDPYQYY